MDVKVGDEISKPVAGTVVRFISDGKVAVVIDKNKKSRFVAVERIVKKS